MSVKNKISHEFQELDTNYFVVESAYYDEETLSAINLSQYITTFSKDSLSSATASIYPDHLVSQIALYKHMFNCISYGSTFYPNDYYFSYLSASSFTNSDLSDYRPYGYWYEYQTASAMSPSGALIQVPIDVNCSITSFDYIEILSGTSSCMLYPLIIDDDTYNFFNGWPLYTDVSLSAQYLVGKATKNGIIWLNSIEGSINTVLSELFVSNPFNPDGSITATLYGGIMVGTKIGISIPVYMTNKQCNYSTNPTWLDNIVHNTNETHDKRVYITNIALYNDNQELMAIAKLALPKKKNDMIRLNYNVTINL